MAKKSGKKAEKESMRFTSKSTIKEHISAKGLRTSGELLEQIDAKVEKLLDQACDRCKDNGRATVRPSDF